MSQSMKIVLTHEAPAAHWGKADVTYNAEQAQIHLQGNDVLRQIQMAARKLRNQGINQVSLVGEGWDLNSQWAFAQGFVTAKGGHEIQWAGDEALKGALTSRAYSASFARSLINETPENLPPLKLAQQAANWLAELGGDKVSYRIVEGEALLQEQWIGIHAVGRGSERPPALLELDFNLWVKMLPCPSRW